MALPMPTLFYAPPSPELIEFPDAYKPTVHELRALREGYILFNGLRVKLIHPTTAKE